MLTMLVLNQCGMKLGEKNLIDLKTTSMIITYFNFKQNVIHLGWESSIQKRGMEIEMRNLVMQTFMSNLHP